MARRLMTAASSQGSLDGSLQDARRGRRWATAVQTAIWKSCPAQRSSPQQPEHLSGFRTYPAQAIDDDSWHLLFEPHYKALRCLGN